LDIFVAKNNALKMTPTTTPIARLFVNKTIKSDAVVMLLTVIIVLFTNNLAIVVVVGFIFSALFFATKISNIRVELNQQDKSYLYYFKGQIFFVSIDSMMEQLDFTIENSHIELDFTDAHLWDDSAVDAIDTIVKKFED